jgi:hypothetical protein
VHDLFQVHLTDVPTFLLIEKRKCTKQFFLVIDVRLPGSKLQARLHESSHRKEALFSRVDSFFELNDILFRWEEPGGPNQFGCIVWKVPISEVLMVLALLLFFLSS